MAVSQDLNDQIRTHEKPMEELESRGRTARKQVVEELATVNGILAAKATPQEAASFRLWLVQAAEGTAEAAKEGGFLGVGATQVSKGESAMLEEIGRSSGSPRTDGRPAGGQRDRRHPSKAPSHGASRSGSDGTRTRGLRIDSPVL